MTYKRGPLAPPTGKMTKNGQLGVCATRINVSKFENLTKFEDFINFLLNFLLFFLSHQNNNPTWGKFSKMLQNKWYIHQNALKSMQK